MRFVISFIVTVLLTSPAFAASSKWLQADGGSLRFIARETPSGNYEAALQVKLEPGFKTYWKVPGSSGLPPVLKLSSGRFSGHIPGASVTTQWPAPTIFKDGLGLITGYENSAIILFDIEGADTLQELTLNGIIGICGEICIPVQFSLSTKLTDTGANKLDEAQAFAAGRASLIKAPDINLHANANELSAQVSEDVENVFWVSSQPGTTPVKGMVTKGRAVFKTKQPLKDNGLLIVDGNVHRAIISSAAN